MTFRIKEMGVLSAALLLVFGWGFAQSSQHEQHHGNQSQQQGMMHGQGQDQMMDQCQMMQDRQQKMMSMMKANDQELESLVEKMKATDNEDQKVQVMENLLARLVENRTEMHQQMMGGGQMMGMMPMMMQHMSQHMRMAQKSGDASMMNCPMMSGQPAEGSTTMQNPENQR